MWLWLSTRRFAVLARLCSTFSARVVLVAWVGHCRRQVSLVIQRCHMFWRCPSSAQLQISARRECQGSELTWCCPVFRLAHCEKAPASARLPDGAAIGTPLQDEAGYGSVSGSAESGGRTRVCVCGLAVYDIQSCGRSECCGRFRFWLSHTLDPPIAPPRSHAHHPSPLEFADNSAQTNLWCARAGVSMCSRRLWRRWVCRSCCA